MREANYTAALRRALIAEGIYPLKLSLAHNNGVPDCWYSGSSTDLWSEHKKVDAIPPTLRLTNPKITTPLQQDWLVKRHGEGRNVCMIVFSPEGHLLLPGLAWQREISRGEYYASAYPNYKSLATALSEFLNDPNNKTRGTWDPRFW